jgi:hypothetical protein
MRPIVAAGMAFALCVALAVRSSTADVAEWIPADALVVFKVNNIQQVNTDASALLREFGVAEQDPAMANPLAALQQETGIREGVNLDGNLAVYLANGDLEGEVPPMVILIPVSDYQAFLGNFQNRQDEGGGITRVRMGNQEDMEEGEMGDDDDAGYIMEMGEYAGLSPIKELLKKPEQAIEFGGVTAGMLDERDMVVYANFRTVGPMLLQMMQQHNARDQAKQEMKEGLAENEQFARFEPVADIFIDQVFDFAERFLNEADAAAVTMDLGEQGIGLGSVGQFKPDSYMANLFGEMAASDEPLLSGLPEGNYIAFGGSTDNREMTSRLFEDLLGPVVARLREVEGSEKLATYIEAIKTQVSAAGESRMGWFAPSGPVGNSPLLQQVVIQGGDVAALKQAQRQVAELQPEIMAELMGEELEGMGMNMAMTYEAEAKEVAGVTFDKLSADMEQMEQQQQQGMGALPMGMIFGPEGPTTYLGQVDDHLLMVGGLNDQQITSVIEAVRDDSAPLADDEGVQMVLDQLPDSRTAVFFFRPDELVKSGVGLARQMGMNLPIQMRDNLPPAGFAVAPAEHSVRAEAFIPKDLISAMIVAGLQAQQQMGGMQDDGL